MTLASTAFVAQIGADELAGVGLAGVVGFALVCFGVGLLRGAKTLVSQAVGAGRRDRIPELLGAAIGLALALGARRGHRRPADRAAPRAALRVAARRRVRRAVPSRSARSARR